MIALVCQKPHILNYVETPCPKKLAGNAIIKILRVGLCGTDYHAFEGNQPFFQYPRILGHEIAAQIVDVQDNPQFKIGDYVTVYPYLSCGKCIACRRGKNNCCVNMSVLGVHQDGAMQQYLSVPFGSLVHGEGLKLEDLPLIEPFAIAAHGVSLAQVGQQDCVLVIGAGPIGLGTAKIAQLNGASVIVADLNDERLNFCRQKLQIPFTVNPKSEDMKKRLLEITGGDLPTIVIDCTGNVDAINSTIDYLAHGGSIILIGLQKRDIVISHPEFHKREATMRSSRNATKKDFEAVINFIKRGMLLPSDFITHRVPFLKVKEEFSKMVGNQQEIVKAIIEFSELPEQYDLESP